MPEFPYTPVTGKLKTFFQKMLEVGQPPTVNVQWLSSIGFKSSNDRKFIPIVKFIGFADQSGKPLGRWLTYRDKSHSGKVLAEGIRAGYTELFGIYPNAHERGVGDLENFFSTRTKGGAQVVSQTVATFMTLCKLADFSDTPVETMVSSKRLLPEGTKADIGSAKHVSQGLGPGITVNINIQLTVPDTTDETVYDKFFAALKKHLLT